jgi:OmpA-OmpF porin, OOP family
MRLFKNVGQLALCALIQFGICQNAYSQYQEKQGGVDHPMVSRFAKSVLTNYGKISFDHVEFPVGANKKEAVEGAIFNYFYLAPKERTNTEVYRSFKTAFETAGFKLLVACEDERKCQDQEMFAHAQRWTNQSNTFDGGYNPTTAMDAGGGYPPKFLVAQISSPNGVSTILVTVKSPNSSVQAAGFGAPYFVQVVESKSLQAGQVVVSTDVLAKALSNDGKIALYGVYFDTGKAIIKEESKAQIDEIGKMLTEKKLLKVHIVGHTDNVGSVEANMSLSKKCADAVVSELIKLFRIEPNRLTAYGVASLNPVTTNSTENGKSKNRRVEIVEQ